MPLVCAVCASDVRADSVCHHCGKPLCPGCRLLVDSDEAFSGQVAAVHCQDCKGKYHDKKTGLRALTSRLPGQKARRVP